VEKALVRNWALRAGVVLQGLVLGILLFVALISAMVLSTGARVFRYENF
jgi:hypothetical protein